MNLRLKCLATNSIMGIDLWKALADTSILKLDTNQHSKIIDFQSHRVGQANCANQRGMLGYWVSRAHVEKLNVVQTVPLPWGSAPLGQHAQAHFPQRQAINNLTKELEIPPYILPYKRETSRCKRGIFFLSLPSSFGIPTVGTVVFSPLSRICSHHLCNLFLFVPSQDERKI